MSKLLKVTQDVVGDLKSEFEKALNNITLSDGKISFSKTFSDDRKAKVLYTPAAWIKQSYVVKEFDSEVAWHGVAKRVGEPDDDVYLIEDIMVYPQEVTGATVNTDQKEYQSWLMALDDDVFNNLRMQGHSHVNMGVTPSSVDTSLYDRMIETLDDDMFYIFMIWNKRGEKTIKIYDFLKNRFFDTCDVTVGFDGLGDFPAEAKSSVKERKTTYTPTYTYPYPNPKTGSAEQPAYVPTIPTHADKSTKPEKKIRFGKRKTDDSHNKKGKSLMN